MTILQELAALYEARAVERGWPHPGFSMEKIGAVAVLDTDGSLLELRSIMTPDNKGKMHPRSMSVPSVKRTSDITPAAFWDKTAYVFGITQTPDGAGQAKRTIAEHEAFKAEHLKRLKGAEDPALIALYRYCKTWMPERFMEFPDAVNLLDQNVVFQLGDGPFLHELPAARDLLVTAGEDSATCLVSGRLGPIARLHPSIKGVVGAQSSGASLISFNNDAETSYGKSQGQNAPVSQSTAFAYGTALNALLAKGSGNYLRIGGDTVVFWSDQPEIELIFNVLVSGSDDRTAERDLVSRLRAIAQGARTQDETLDPGSRLFVLGLAPNAARLSVRYWYPGTLGDFAQNFTQFWNDMAIEPYPFVKDALNLPPKPWALLYDLAAQRDAKNIPDGLAGDLMRSLLTGGPYPMTLLATVIRRIRIDGDPDQTRRHGNVDGRRAAIIAAVLRRNFEEKVPIALDEDERDVAYLLGRLFGAYACAEQSHQSNGAGLRQKYLASASAMPARVFPTLMRNYEYTLSSLTAATRVETVANIKAERTIHAIQNALCDEPPEALPLSGQGRFFIGFYHQTSALYAKAAGATDALSEDEGSTE